MRVLLIVNSLRPGGAEKHVVSLVNHLERGEFELLLGCLHPGRDLLREIEPGRLQQVVDCDVRSKVDLAAARRLARVIDDARIDVVLCTNLYAMLYGTLARALARRKPKLIEVFHTTLLGSWRLRMQLLFYWSLFRACDRLVYVCEAQRKHWRQRGLRARSDQRIYNGIDTDWFAPARVGDAATALRERSGFADNDLVIGICAGLRPEKAHGDLLEAVARLRAEGLPARCLVIGDGPERGAIERARDRLRLGDHVVLAGVQADVRAHIRACDVMALVSRSVETFSISALESMALARPMVMSRIGGAAEQVTDGVNGFTFQAGDIEGLVACLRKLADEPARTRMGDAARQVVVERFGVEAMARRYGDMLHEVGGAGRAGGRNRNREG